MSANRWLELLQIDPVGRRAIDETRLDWIEESGAARTPFAWLVVAIRYAVALVSVTTRVSLRQTWRSSFGWLMLVAIASVVPALVWIWVDTPRVVKLWPERYWLDYAVSLLPSVALPLLPAAAFFITFLSSPRRGRLPIVTISTVTTVVTALAAIALPHGNEHFRAVSLWVLRSAPVSAPITLADSSAGAIARAALGAIASAPEWRYWWLAVWIPVTASAVLVAGALDRRSRRVRVPAAVLAIPVYVAIGASSQILVRGIVQSIWGSPWWSVPVENGFTFAGTAYVLYRLAILIAPQSPPALSPPPHRSARLAP